MKIKVFRLIIDPPFGDLTVQLFGSEAQRDAALIEHNLSAEDAISVLLEDDEIEIELPALTECVEACRIHHDALAKAFLNPPPEVADVMDGLAITISKLENLSPAPTVSA